MFKEHGEFKIWVTKDILYARLSGTWNEETAIHYVKEFKRLVDNDLPDKWAHVVYLDRWEMGTPEVEPVIEELVDWGVAHGGVHVAQVFGKAILKFQLDKMVTTENPKLCRKQFEAEREALCWLQECGFYV
ncbi:hypothetical protein P7F88_01410 [Vibrio hannami]|uniref:hypothetical protein n=1 Tax=Vibrio hannami TaxID=2717094 RepID=UPI00240FFF9E|nr:hypothetical protein [Vibrio hannami]MDG3084815.1 hypothetical protein [Vibrio hannami]